VNAAGAKPGIAARVKRRLIRLARRITGLKDPRLEITLVRELERACAARGATPFIPYAAPYQWANACHDLFEAGRLDVSEYAARSLHARYPGIPYLAKLAAFFDAAPRGAPVPLPFHDDPSAEIQLVQRPGCEKVLLCFCAAEGTLGLPLNFVHQWLGRLPVSLVYIKDFQNLSGGGGYPALAPDRSAAIAALRRIAAELGGKEIYGFGVSLGGFAALYYGLALEAVAILCLCGATDYTRDFVETLGPIPKAYLNLCNQAPDFLVSLRASCAAARDRTRVLMAYSALYPRDRLQAERLAGLSNVQLIPVSYAQHNVIDPLVRRREFSPLLSRLVTTEPPTAYVG
jgi:hypothetical protein